MNWNFGGWDNNTIETTTKAKFKKIIEKQIKVIGEVGIPAKGEQIRIITERNINAFSMIEYFLNKNAVIDEMYLSIYRINGKTVDELLHRIQTKQIKKSHIIVCSFFRNVNEGWFKKLSNGLKGMDNVEFASDNIHTKIIAFKSFDEHYVFEGSGNLSDNARVEQYLFENSEQMYSFHKNWMQEIIDNQNKTKKEWNIKTWNIKTW